MQPVVKSSVSRSLNEQEIDKVSYSAVDIGRIFAADRIALHHVILPVQSRTSLPHAESHEEEFVMVVRGRPTLWQDGKLYALDVGDVVGFAAGTGIAHSFLNNDSAVCELLVAGEKTKSINTCAFPVNPEVAKEIGSFNWSTCPIRDIGEASPLPACGATGDHRKSARPSNIANWFHIRENLPFSYPTCKVQETFTVGRDVTAEIGLEKLGIYIDRLQPGKRSSWPHAHKYEDELLFVISGSVDVWLNGKIIPATSGDFIGFKAGTGDAHTIMNRGDSDAVLFTLGERSHDYVEKIFYPQHPDQNELNKLKGRYWEDVLIRGN